MTDLPAQSALSAIDSWPVDHAAAAMVRQGTTTTHGDVNRPFALASLTKLITSLTILVAHEEGTISLDETVTEGGATVADLLAHAGGVAPDSSDQIAEPRTRRVYSTAAYDLVAAHLAAAAGMSFEDYATEAVLEPAGMGSTTLQGSAGAGAIGSVDDLLRLARCWTEPSLISDTTLARATSAHIPALNGVLPGFGRHEPNQWGLGPEIRGWKQPHWTGLLNSESTFGHFGRTGTMIWIDPVHHTTLIALSDCDFGPWAAQSWPQLSDQVVEQS